MLSPSRLVFRSIGYVAANKPLASGDPKKPFNEEIEVVLVEQLQMVDGELSDNIEKLKASGTDMDGSAYSVETDTSNSIKAIWLPFARGNRLSPPDLRRGSRVMVWQFDEAEPYYWTEMDDLGLRKLETVVWAFSANPDEKAPFDINNCYFIELSTHTKIIHLHTSVANKEKAGFDIQINGAEGFLQIQDTLGQSFMLNSIERQLEMLNNDGSRVLIDKREIHFEAEDLIALKSKKVTIDATDMIGTITNNTLKATKNVITASTNELTADDNTITAKTNHKGDYSISGKLNVTQKATFSGGFAVGGSISSLSGGFDFAGGGMLAVDSIKSTGNVTAPNIR